MIPVVSCDIWTFDGPSSGSGYRHSDGAIHEISRTHLTWSAAGWRWWDRETDCRWCRGTHSPARSPPGRPRRGPSSWDGTADSAWSPRRAAAWSASREVLLFQTPVDGRKKMIKTNERLEEPSKYLINHVPVESIEHSLAVVMLSAQLRPKLRSDGRIYRPSVLPYQKLHLALLALLNQTFDVVECLERLLLSCERSNHN